MNVGVVKWLDKYLGTPLCYFFGLLKIPWKLDDPKRILVIQLWGIGESILTLPSIAALRKLYPKARIELLCTPRIAEVYRKNEDIDMLRKVDLGPLSVLKFAIGHAKRYDLVIDMEEYLNISSLISYLVGKHRVGFSHGARSLIYHRQVPYNDKQHVVQTFLDLIRTIGSGEKGEKLLPLKTTPKENKEAQRVIRKNGEKGKIVAIAPGAAESAKARIWPIEGYAELSDYILHHYPSTILFTGTEEEKELIDSIMAKMDIKAGAVNLAGKLTLPELFALLEKVDLFIGNDSGPMHIAAAQGTRTIGLFGPNLPVRFGPYGKKCAGIYKGGICKFSPCINVHWGEVPDCLYPKAGPDYQKCMKNISVGDVISEVDRLIK